MITESGLMYEDVDLYMCAALCPCLICITYSYTIIIIYSHTMYDTCHVFTCQNDIGWKVAEQVYEI